MEPEARFKIDELAEATDLSRRTIHHYIAEGMIPRARGGAGPAAYYDEEHYLRLRILARLKWMGLSLSTIRDSLNDLSLEEMREVLELPESLDYRAIWAHIAMKRSGTPESFRVEEAELAEARDDMQWSRMEPESRYRARQMRREIPPPDADLRQDVLHSPSSPGTIRRDSLFVDGLAARQRPESEESLRRRTAHRPDPYYDPYEDEESVDRMMGSAAQYSPALRAETRAEPLHPEMDSQPWRRVRVSSDLEISYRPSSDPLTKKKLRHLLDFVHRLFRLERSAEGLTPDGLTPEGLTPDGLTPAGQTTGNRISERESESTGRPRTPGERPQEEEP